MKKLLLTFSFLFAIVPILTSAQCVTDPVSGVITCPPSDNQMVGIGSEMVGIGGGASSLLLKFISILIVILIPVLLFSHWKLLTKAGKPGWASLIPIYNIVVTLQIVQKPGWWVILMFIPFVNILVGLYVTHLVAQAFGKGIGFTIGLIIFPIIFLPILALGSSQYRGGNNTMQPQMA